jgi:hypothetical protein
MRMNKTVLSLGLALGALFAPLAVQAITLDDAGRFELSGFYTLTAAKVLNGSATDSTGAHYDQWQYMQWNCPCTIQNWEYVGVYEKSKGWQADQESLLGLQLRGQFTPDLGATVQIISRPTNAASQHYTPSVDWAYLSWKVNDDWTLQLGRKRIPLYYYSDYLYIGYAYPWVRPAPDVYGWPIFEYDGVTAQYSRSIGNGDWTFNANGWYGEFSDNKNRYNELIYYGPSIHESWKRITGAWASVSNGTIEARLMMMMHHENTTFFDSQGAATVYNDNQFTRIVGASLNVDYDNWLLRSELNEFSQRPNDPSKFVYDYALVGVGYKVGAFTPMVTYSQYMTAENNLVPQEGRRTWYLSLRWDFMKNTALKFQLDDTKDRSKYPYPFFGNSKLLSVSLQGTF